MHKKKQGKQVYVKKLLDAIKYDASTFKQIFEKYLKVAWYRLHEMHDKDPNPCSEARLNANFHLGLES
jgi:hypothetical protein